MFPDRHGLDRGGFDRGRRGRGDNDHCGHCGRLVVLGTSDPKEEPREIMWTVGNVNRMLLQQLNLRDPKNEFEDAVLEIIRARGMLEDEKIGGGLGRRGFGQGSFGGGDIGGFY
jgi:hypothetical protein